LLVLSYLRTTILGVYLLIRRLAGLRYVGSLGAGRLLAVYVHLLVPEGQANRKYDIIFPAKVQ
jgi:hypothetical protein